MVIKRYSVITSYSIHYTKLYDMVGAIHLTHAAFTDLVHESVITSYSIHYTKLYEMDRKAPSATTAIRRPIDVWSSDPRSGWART